MPPTDKPLSTVCPPVMATTSLARILNVTFASEVAAARIASDPECENVPSPRFTKTCLVSVKCDNPIQLTPSAPICVQGSELRSMNCTRPWQPMPATPNEPSGSLVDRLCGQPEQNTGRRASGPTSICLNDAARPERPSNATRNAARSGEFADAAARMRRLTADATVAAS